jgi:hypothetical protein
VQLQCESERRSVRTRHLLATVTFFGLSAGDVRLDLLLHCIEGDFALGLEVDLIRVDECLVLPQRLQCTSVMR